MQREYFGSIALAKRYNPEVLDIVGEVIHKDDKFKYKIENGRKYLVEHDQPFENLDKDIIGAYATVILREGEPYIVPMTMKEIRAAWGQGATKGNSPAHQNFSGEMAKKSAINRACKPYINSSDDSEIVKNRNSQDYVSEQANSKKIDFVEDGEAEEVKDERPEEKTQPEPKTKHLEQMPFKNMNEAKSFLIDNGVHPAALKSEQDIHDAAATKEIEIVIDGPDF
jgi:recombination protein RecT